MAGTPKPEPDPTTPEEPEEPEAPEALTTNTVEPIPEEERGK